MDGKSSLHQHTANYMVPLNLNLVFGSIARVRFKDNGIALNYSWKERMTSIENYSINVKQI